MKTSAGARFMCSVATAVICAAAMIAAQREASPASPRKTPPTGSEIAAAARAGTLDPANAGTATMFGKPFRFIPVRAQKTNSRSDPFTGQFVGVLENGAAGDETGLPAGRYNLFVTQVNGRWKAYAESGGQIIREAVRASVEPESSRPPGKPAFSEKGWCVWGLYYVVITAGWWKACF